MKCIVAVVRGERLEALEQRLQDLGVAGISVSQVKGFGEYANFFTHDWLVPHARIEIYAPDERVEMLVEAIHGTCRTGVPGDGLIAVSPVERFEHIRTEP